MQATVGDRLVVRGHHLGEPDRDGEILEVHGDGGGPPYSVRWSEDGHIGLVFPGPDATIDHLSTTRTDVVELHPDETATEANRK